MMLWGDICHILYEVMHIYEFVVLWGDLWGRCRASVHFLPRPASPRLCLSCQPHHQMHHHRHHHHQMHQHDITILKHHHHHHIIKCIDIIFVTMALRDIFSVFIVYCTVFTVHCAQCMYNIQCMLYTHKACNASKMRNEKIGKVLESVHSKDNAFIETYKKLKVNIWIIMFSLKTNFSFACYLHPIKKN